LFQSYLSACLTRDKLPDIQKILRFQSYLSPGLTLMSRLRKRWKK